jgi:hypothetical protein
MGPPTPEITRELDDGFVIAWDTNQIDETVRESLREVADAEVDLVSGDLAASLEVIAAPSEPELDRAA